MAIVYEVPLTNAPQQMQVTFASVTYQITVTWNHIGQQWQMDIAEADGTPLVNGIPLVAGLDLLEPYEYLGFGVRLFVQTDNDTLADPTYDNLGTNAHLYVTPIT